MKGWLKNEEINHESTKIQNAKISLKAGMPGGWEA